MVPITPPAVSLFGAPLSSAASLPTPVSTSGLPSFATAVAPVSNSSPVPIATAGIAAGSAAPFAGLLTESLGQVQQLELQARSAVEGLMSGKGVDVHEAMIATEKAEMGFELVLSVRNKALAAYQQVLGMQF